MKCGHFHSLRRICWHLAAAASSLIFISSVALAQPPADMGRPAGKTPKEQTQDRQRSEFRLRNVEESTAQAQVNQQRLHEAIELVRNDFKRIQVIRNEMVSDLMANKPLEYKLIIDQTGEIDKRAHRLKTFLMAPIPEEKEKEMKHEVEYKHEELKGALIKLCNTIYAFTENPVLKTPGVVDVEQSAKAGRDLMLIIELSGNIRRSVEKLRDQ